MNFTRPVNASSSNDTTAKETTSLSFWSCIGRCVKKIFKGIIYLLLIGLILGGIAIFFAPQMLSQSWAQPFLLKTLLPSIGEKNELSVHDAQLSWWEDQVFYNVRFHQTTPSEEREILIGKVIVKGGLFSLAPWKQQHALNVEAFDMEVIRTPLDTTYQYQMENHDSPLPETLSLNASVKTMRVYPFSKDGPELNFSTATMTFASPSQPLQFTGEGSLISVGGEPLGSFQSELTLTSANAFRSFSSQYSTYTPLERAMITFDGPLGDGRLEARGQEGRLFPWIKASGSIDLAWWLAKSTNAPWMSSEIQSLSGVCLWTIEEMLITDTEMTFKTTFRAGTSTTPVRITYEDVPYTLYATGSTNVVVASQHPQSIKLSDLSVQLPFGQIKAIANLSTTTLQARGDLIANLEDLWTMPAMEGLRNEGVQMTGQGTYPFTYQGPFTFDRTTLFQSATASLVLMCETLTIQEKVLPNITFNLNLEEAMLHCKGDFTVRNRPFHIRLPMAEVFGSKRLDANTLRAYFPQIKGTP
ncbi:MAG: hypothetical protein Q4F99_04525 [bacterium]|nr:hypothetical protein [bacterium]